MKLKGFLNAVNHQLSPLSTYLLESVGFLDITSVSYYKDYRVINDSRIEMIACEPDVFVSIKETVSNASQIVVVGNRRIKRLLQVWILSKDKGAVSVPLQNTYNSIIDLSENGERWEGEVVDDYPCGWGCFYNADNVLCYEGFRYKEDTVCYGTSFFADVVPKTKCYEGMLSFSLRCGRGTEFDRRSEVVYDGYWMNNRRMTDNEVVVPANTLDQLFHNTMMKRFVLEEGCYPRFHSFTLTHFPLLKEVLVGLHCFNPMLPNDDSQSIASADAPLTDSRFYIAFCSALESITIDGDSFFSFASFVLEFLPSLRHLRIGVGAPISSSFPFCHHFQLASLPQLVDVVIGDYSFMKQQLTVFQGGCGNWT